MTRWVETAIPSAFADEYVFVLARTESRDLWLLLDSGASSTLLTPQVIAALGLERRGQRFAFGIGSAPADVDVYAGVNLVLGNAVVAAQEILALDPRWLPRAHGHAIDGIIGADLLGTHAIHVDYSNRTVALREAADSSARQRDEIPLRIVQRLPTLSAIVYFGHVAMPATLLLDLGAANGIVLSEAGLRRIAGTTLIPGAAIRAGAGIRLGGVGGNVDVFEVNADSAKFGTVTATDARVAIAPDSALLGPLAIGADGLVGADVLREFGMILDYPRTRAILLPLAAVRRVCMRVLGVCVQVGTVGPPRLDAVDPGSPAARAGCRAGDLLLAVDEVPVTAIPRRDLAATLQRAGSATRLSTQDARTHAVRRVSLIGR